MRFGAWLVAYLLAMALLSFLGDSHFGGIDLLASGWDIAAVVVVALALYGWGVRQGVAFAAVAPTGAGKPMNTGSH